MAVNSQENMKIVLDRLCSPGCRLSHATRGIGHERLIFQWLRRDDLFVENWPDEGDRMLFRDAVTLARKQQIIIFENVMRSEATEGIPRIVIDGGKVCWREREDISRNGHLKADPELLFLLYGQYDVFERDSETGDRLPLVVYDPAPAATRVHMLKSLMPATYGDRKVIDVNQKFSGGVMVVGATKRAQPASMDAGLTHAQLAAQPPGQAHGPPPPPPMKMITHAQPAAQPPGQAHGVETEVTPPREGRDGFEQAAEPGEVEQEIEDVAATSDEPMAYETDDDDDDDDVSPGDVSLTEPEPPPPTDPTLVINPGDNELVRDLKRRLAAGVANPRPTRPVAIGQPGREPEDRDSADAVASSAPRPAAVRPGIDPRHEPDRTRGMRVV